MFFPPGGAPEAFSVAFFNDSVRFGQISGPSEPLKSWFSHGRYCNFEEIVFFPPGGVPEVIFWNSGPILGDFGPQNRSQKLSKVFFFEVLRRTGLRRL